MQRVMILLLVALSGCQSVQKATAYLDKKGALPKLCADRFPPIDSTVVRWRVVQGEPVVVSVDSAECPDVIPPYQGRAEGKPYKVPCPPNTHRVDTVWRDSIVFRASSAERAYIGDLQRKVAVLEDDVEELESESNKKSIAIVVILALLGLYVAVKLRFRLPL